MKFFQKSALASLFKRYNSSYLAKNQFIKVNDQIKDAVRNNSPVVALESTIITHGLPYPNNYETALEVENVIRDAGGIPATIAFLNGMLKVGLTKDEIEIVAKSSIKNTAVKLSRRDLSYALANQSNSLIGGTTVSATMIAAEAAKIPIFVTGGIGGVHRDFTESMDVSADLIELSKTKVTVISSGIKSILDIGKTLEYLETFGVNVCTLDERGSNEFPAFFTSKSGFYAPYNLKSTEEAARLIDTHFKIGLQNGLLIGVPIPEEYSIDQEYIEIVIKEALENAKRFNIKGKAITPYLLETINKLTSGKSLESNIELIKNNAKVGANIAKKLSELRNKEKEIYSINNNDNHVTLIGGINIDFAFKLIDDKTMKLKGVTQPCAFNSCLGGVARNMAESLIRFGNNSTLLSTISNDLVGNSILEKSKSIGFDTSKFLILDHAKQTSTGSYCSLFDKQGELILGLGAMDAHDYIKPEYLKDHEKLLEKSSICIVDADLSVESLRYIFNKCYEDKLPVWYNPTDLRKCMRVIEAKSLSKVTFISPNSKELLAIFLDMFGKSNESDDRINEIQIKQKLNTSELKNLEKLYKTYKKSNQIEKIDQIDNENLKLILKYLLIYVPFIFLSRGSNDLILASACKLNLHEHHQLPIRKVENKEILFNEWSPQLTYFPVIKLELSENIVNVSGAGDNTSAGIISGILKDYDLIKCVYNGLLAAKYTLMTNENVSPKISTIDSKILDSIINEYKNGVKIENF